jgi:cytochrome c
MAIRAPRIAALVFVAASSGGAQANDPEALMKRSGCFRCHAVAQEKVGPAYRDVAAKYRGSADGEQRIFIHLTTSPRIRIDGQEETHVSLRNASETDVRSVARWILSQ